MNTWQFMLRKVLILAFAFWALSVCTTLAQVVDLQTETTKLEALIEKAQKEGVRVIVVDPSQVSQSSPAPTRSAQSLAVRMQANAVRARDRLVQILIALPKFPEHAYDAIVRQSPTNTSSWTLVTFAWTLVFLFAGWLVRYVFANWADGKILALFPSAPENTAEKIGFLYARATISILSLGVQLAVAALLVVAFDMGRMHVRSTAMLVIACWGVVAGFSIFLKNLLAVDVPLYRSVRIGDREAHTFYRNFIGVFAFAMLVLGLCFWMDLLGIDRSAHVFALVVSQLIVTVCLALVTIHHRHDVAHMLFGYRPAFAWPIWQRLIASLWHVPVILYFFVAWAVSANRLLLDQPNALGLVGRPILFMMAAMALYGAYLLLVELILAQSEVPSQTVSNEKASSDPSTFLIRPSYKDLAQRVGAIVSVIFVVAATIRLWGVRPFVSTGWANALMDIMVVAFIAYICWSTAKIAIDRRLMAEGGPAEIVPGEIGGGGASRLSTVLPLFANFLLIFIAAIAVMVILSELGVNVTPLFAGAGIVGLAIGFGAQTLVRDIFSGVFFLIDDAFRQGEFIEVGAVKGTVERISLRSLQLRHHLGPLNTIPFGEIKHVENFSRDWVMMKLPIRLTYDTDAEKVRKLINNFGKELLKDPQVGGDFLQPLKSQGIIQMDESAQIMRVKFMSKPGQQWVIRRKVLNGIRELFEREGIEFAHHEVTVRVAQESSSQQLTEEQKHAAGAAAQRVAALQNVSNKGKSDGEL